MFELHRFLAGAGSVDLGFRTDFRPPSLSSESFQLFSVSRSKNFSFDPKAWRCADPGIDLLPRRPLVLLRGTPEGSAFPLLAKEACTESWQWSRSASVGIRRSLLICLRGVPDF